MIEITKSYGLDDFEPWSGAIDTIRTIRDLGKTNEFEDLLDELWPEGIDETALNDYLWFDAEQIYETLGIVDFDNEEIREQLIINTAAWAEKTPDVVSAKTEKEFLLGVQGVIRDTIGEFGDSVINVQDAEVYVPEVVKELIDLVDPEDFPLTLAETILERLNPQKAEVSLAGEAKDAQEASASLANAEPYTPDKFQERE